MRIFLFALVALLFEGFSGYRPVDTSIQTLLKKKRLSSISCTVNFSAFDLAANPIPLLKGWGSYRMPVTGSNDSALIYFQQGINMYYGFHIIEALASFDKSIRFDSTFAMGYWGKALSYGPNINDIAYSESPAAWQAAHKAKALYGHTTPVEKALIDAIQPRYSLDSTVSRQRLNQQYVDAMKAAFEKFSRNADVGALYADALMQQHPWDLYERDGRPKSWTPPIVAVLEQTLKLNPQHPGAAHYYIHAVEASNQPERALAAADRLPLLMPGVSHVVHMPSHIYIRTGNYVKGWDVNVSAVAGYYDYLGKFPSVADNSSLYLMHNIHMQVANACMDGRYKDAMISSIDVRNSLDSTWLSLPDFAGIYTQYVYMTPLLTQVRFGKWDEIIAAPQIPAAYIYADILTHYARGIAFARKGQGAEAEKELAILQQDSLNPQLRSPAPNYSNPGINMTRVAEYIVAGVISESQYNLQQSISAFRKAVEFEDAMIYDEPKDWQQPARQFLGNVLLKAGRYKEAEETFREDLQINPQNGWSYTGWETALSKQGRQSEAAAVGALAKKALTRSDMKINAAVY